MFSSLFFAQTLFVVFLFVVCAFCGTAYADDPDDVKTPEKIKIFKSEDLQDIILPEGDINGKKGSFNIQSFCFPVLLATGDVMVVVVGGKQEQDSKKTAILTRYIETKDGSGWLRKVFVQGEIDKNWKKQFALQQSEKEKYIIKSLAAVATKSKIYAFMVNESAESPPPEGGSQKWECVLVEGAIVGEGTKEKKITWTATKKPDLLKENQLEDKNLKSYPQFLSAFVTGDETVVFIVKGETQEKEKIFFAIIEKKDVNADFEVVAVADINKKCNLNFFLLGDKVVMIPNSCNGNEKIQEFDIATRKLGECNKCVKRVWGFLQDKNAITTATINNTLVLFTKQQIRGTTEDIYLWITDGNRLHNVGLIFTSDKEKITVASLLYTKEQLFSLHQETESKSIILTGHKEQLEKIKTTLTAWKDSDEKVQRLCAATATSPETTCTTDGLIGFLSGSFSGKTQDGQKWKDNYLNEHATIYGGAEIKDNNGVKFNGANAGAVWLVSKQKDEDQPYKLKEFGFTFIATVTIDAVADEKNSVLGVVVKKAGNEVATNSIGLWCNTNNKWTVSVKKDKSDFMDSQEECKQGKTYSIAIAFEEKTKPLKIYVNGEQLRNLDNEKMKIDESESIKHFYFAANENDENTATDVTITNVLLYNRLLTSQEIKAFKPKESEIDTEKKLENTDTKKQQNPEEGTPQIDSSLQNTSPTKNETKDEESSSPPPTTEDSAARVGVVGVLCFMLFGVFTLLGRYVY